MTPLKVNYIKLSLELNLIGLINKRIKIEHLVSFIGPETGLSNEYRIVILRDNYFIKSI